MIYLAAAWFVLALVSVIVGLLGRLKGIRFSDTEELENTVSFYGAIIAGFLVLILRELRLMDAAA